MAIPLHILLPSAAAAVLLVSLFIWWITGTRSQTISEETVRTYFAEYYPSSVIEKLVVNSDRNIALVRMSDNSDIKLVRSLGNKLIDQEFSLDELDIQAENNVHFPRQGIAFSPLNIVFSEDDYTAIGVVK